MPEKKIPYRAALIADGPPYWIIGIME